MIQQYYMNFFALQSNTAYESVRSLKSEILQTSGTVDELLKE